MSSNYLTLEDFTENIVIIKINKLYSKSMSAQELYEATRGIWKRRIESVNEAEYCLAVSSGIVVEAYKINDWHQAGTTEYSTRVIKSDRCKGRIEFTGVVADEVIRNKYIGKFVTNIFKRGEASPLKTIFNSSSKVTKSSEYRIVDANDRVEYHSIFGAINECAGTEMKGWMKATWPTGMGNGKFRMWFPKLAETKNGELVSAAFNCVNTISQDWNEVVFDDLKGSSGDMDNKYRGYDLIFAKEPNGGPYLFRGVYVRDEEKSKPNHDVSKRVATRVKLIGSPAYDIELLDDVSDKGINSPLQPKNIETNDDGIIYFSCARCDTRFIKNIRCPECGQLQHFEDELLR